VKFTKREVEQGDCVVVTLLMSGHRELHLKKTSPRKYEKNFGKSVNWLVEKSQLVFVTV